jgi:thiol-disulfide isomerase/thioredoxin
MTLQIVPDSPRDRLKKAWNAPTTLRVRQIGYWVIMGVLLFYVYRRVAPSVEFDDFGLAPPIEMATLDGGQFTLDGVRGKVVVVNVWATWCPPCRFEMPGFVKLQREFEGDVVFVGLSTDDSVEPVHEFVESMGINFPILVGPNRAGTGYHVPVLPTTVLIDRNGHVRFIHEGMFLAHALRPALRALSRE